MTIWMLGLWPALMHALEGSYAGTCRGYIVNSNVLRSSINYSSCIQLTAAQKSKINFSVNCKVVSYYARILESVIMSVCVSQVRAPGFDGLAGEDGL